MNSISERTMAQGTTSLVMIGLTAATLLMITGISIWSVSSPLVQLLVAALVI